MTLSQTKRHSLTAPKASKYLQKETDEADATFVDPVVDATHKYLNRSQRFLRILVSIYLEACCVLDIVAIRLSLGFSFHKLN